jgi:hypothetical protein
MAGEIDGFFVRLYMGFRTIVLMRFDEINDGILMKMRDGEDGVWYM